MSDPYVVTKYKQLGIIITYSPNTDIVRHDTGYLCTKHSDDIGVIKWFIFKLSFMT